MSSYLIRRLLLAIPTVLGVAVIVFTVLRFTPGDIADHLLADTPAQHDPKVAQRIREDLGLSGNIPEQFARWASGVVRGDLGKSYYSSRPVAGDLWQRLIVSVELGVLSLAVGVLIGLPVGVISALKQDTWIDYLTRGGAILMLAMPAFWMAVLVLLLGSQWFRWAPPARYADIWVDTPTNLAILATPALILGVHLAATQARFTRAQLLEVMRQDYVRTARAKGLPGRAVVLRHALRNSLIPVITVIGLQIPLAVSGTVIMETIFSIPGVGRYAVDGARRADYPVVQGVTVVVAFAVVLANLVVDMSYAWLDPRVREGYR